jgi:hypothetical protein
LRDRDLHLLGEVPFTDLIPDQVDS